CWRSAAQIALRPKLPVGAAAGTLSRAHRLGNNEDAASSGRSPMRPPHRASQCYLLDKSNAQIIVRRVRRQTPKVGSKSLSHGPRDPKLKFFPVLGAKIPCSSGKIPCSIWVGNLAFNLLELQKSLIRKRSPGSGIDEIPCRFPCSRFNGRRRAGFAGPP